MASRWSTEAKKTFLKTNDTSAYRFYADFRQQQYPDIGGGSPAFSLVTAADNRPGSHYLSSGYASYLLPLTSKITMDILAKPTFAYTTATNYTFFSWYLGDATHFMRFRYDPGTDRFQLRWQDGGTVAFLTQAVAYTSDATLQVLQRFTLSLDLTTGTTAGSTFYVGGASVDTAWSGSSDIFSTNQQKLYLNIYGDGTGGNGFEIAYLRVIPNYAATAAEVANGFKDVKNEEIYFPLNGHPTGHTRCNITSRVYGHELERTKENPFGGISANRLIVNLLSPNGQFADDQYAAFSPTDELYNGTASQSYMQHRVGLEMETWNGTDWDTEFSGRVDDDLFRRRTIVKDVSRVTLSAEDEMADIKKRERRKSYVYEDDALCDPTSEASSLLHILARAESAKEWYNFLGNASFGSTTITDSWQAGGGGATIARSSAASLIGTYSASLLSSSSQASIWQYVQFNGLKKLNVGQDWTASIYCKSTAAFNYEFLLSELTASGGAISTAVSSGTVAAGSGWEKLSNTLTISDSSAAMLAVIIRNVSTSVTVYADAAMLIQNDQALNWFADSTVDGSSGYFSADNAPSVSYQSMGFDVDDAATSTGIIIHPWYRVEPGEPIGAHLDDIAEGTAALYLGCDPAGTLKYRTILKTGYADSTALETIPGNPVSIQSVIDVEQANKILGHGVAIIKSSTIDVVWEANASNAFDLMAGYWLTDVISSGGSWPSTVAYGEYYAKWEEVPSAPTPKV